MCVYFVICEVLNKGLEINKSAFPLRPTCNALMPIERPSSSAKRAKRIPLVPMLLGIPETEI